MPKSAPQLASQPLPGPLSIPDLVAQMFDAAVARHQAGQLGVVEALYRAVLAMAPEHAQAAYNLGVALHTQRRLADAVAAYRQATAIRPDYAEAHCNLGVALQDGRDFEAAIGSYRQAIALRPDFAMAHCNLGVALKELGRLDEAVAAYHRAIACQPEYDFAYANLAATLLSQGRLAEAEIACQRALALRPSLAIAHFNLASARKHLGRLDEAAAGFHAALACEPDMVAAHFSLGQTLLLQGDLAAGWPEYEWRWRLPEYGWLADIHGPFAQPRWAGESLAGRTILIYAEQGLGDAIQYVRYVPLVVARGGRVVLAVHPPLRRLFAQSLATLVLPGADGPAVSVVGLDTRPLPPFDVHCPLLSLPMVFGTTLATIPSRIPYLDPDPSAVAAWRGRVDRHAVPGQLRVGVVWAGNPQQSGDRFRSPRLTSMRPLFDVPGVSFVALQVGPGREDLVACDLPGMLDLGAEIGDLADTAAIMAGLDLMVTSCTAPLHLAAGLGVPTWAIISASPHFAWLLGRADNAWYPSLRLYRQEAFGTDWSGVVAQVAADLAARAHISHVGD